MDLLGDFATQGFRKTLAHENLGFSARIERLAEKSVPCPALSAGPLTLLNVIGMTQEGKRTVLAGYDALDRHEADGALDEVAPRQSFPDQRSNLAR